ncbi:MAG: ATP-grasp domain-containing protein [Trueperaceae bacterium]|nr:ATP-grasp domain-containing protein [Trueperaceae bacterium]
MKPTILAIASELKGLPYLVECHRQGFHVLLVMNERLKDELWPWECIDEHFLMPEVRRQPDMTYAVSYLARDRHIERIVALDDYDVEMAAALREHLRLPGMGDSAARLFRDKLANRTTINQQGIREPGFTGIFNFDDLREFMHTYKAPWVLKPRMLAGSEGISKLEESESLWRKLDELGDQKSFYLLEQFIPGDVYHVDALVWQGEVVFSLVSKYGVPPMAALQGRGVFSTRVLPRDHEDALALQSLNKQVVKALGRQYGPTHTEFIKAHHDGQFYFLETAARVGGGNIEKLIEAATGLVIWQEAARIDLAELKAENYKPPKVKKGYAGLIAAPSKIPFADTSSLDYSEIFFRPRSQEFVSLILKTKSFKATEALLAEIAQRFQEDFMP